MTSKTQPSLHKGFFIAAIVAGVAAGVLGWSSDTQLIGLSWGGTEFAQAAFPVVLNLALLSVVFGNSLGSKPLRFWVVLSALFLVVNCLSVWTFVRS